MLSELKFFDSLMLLCGASMLLCRAVVMTREGCTRGG
jgi:hypothetical protein